MYEPHEAQLQANSRRKPKKTKLFDIQIAKQ